MQPLPNLATAESPVAHVFGYMHSSRHHDTIIKYCWPEGDHAALDPVGPSPLIIHKALLAKIAQKWLDCSYTLRGRPEPAKVKPRPYPHLPP